MTRLFDGKLAIAYGHAFVLSDNFRDCSPDESCSGQTNGLCGTAVPGVISLCMGLHTGDVGFTLEVFDAEPPLNADWEEIVEAPFLVTEAQGRLHLEDDNGNCVCEIPIPPGHYRIRYCANNMDLGRDQDVVLNGEDPVDSYGLYIWPQAAVADKIVKWTSSAAYYWHRTVQGFSHYDSLL